MNGPRSADLPTLPSQTQKKKTYELKKLNLFTFVKNWRQVASWYLASTPSFGFHLILLWKSTKKYKKNCEPTVNFQTMIVNFSWPKKICVCNTDHKDINSLNLELMTEKKTSLRGKLNEIQLDVKTQLRSPIADLWGEIWKLLSRRMTSNFWLKFWKKKKEEIVDARGVVAGAVICRLDGNSTEIYTNERDGEPSPRGGGRGSRRELSCIKINLSLGAKPHGSAISRWFFALCWHRIPSLWMVGTTRMSVQILPVPSVGSCVGWSPFIMTAISRLVCWQLN